MRFLPILILYVGLFIVCTVFNKGDTSISEGPIWVNNSCKKWDDIEIENFWSRFLVIAKKKDYEAFRKTTLDSVLLCDCPFSAKCFLTKCSSTLFDSTLLNRASFDSNVVYIDGAMRMEDFPFSIPKNVCVKERKIIGRIVQVCKAYRKDILWNVTFEFIKTEDGYKLLKCGSFGGPCCR